MLRKVIAPLVVCHFISKKRVVNAKALPNDFYQKVDILNKQDRNLANAELINNLKQSIPEKYESIVSNFDNAILQELDYMRVMYKPPLKPEVRLRARQNIVKLIEYKKWTDEELEYLMYLMKYYGCYDE